MLASVAETARASSWPMPLLGAPTPFAAIDSNGNLTQKVDGADTWVYEWNPENQLKRVLKNGAEQARFAYDPLGRRVEKVAGGVTTAWTYDRQDTLRDVHGAVTLKYLRGLGLDEPLATDDGSALTYFHPDALGSVSKTTNATGAVTLARRYDAWGTLETGATTAGPAFTGREWDPEIQAYYYRARYYDPKPGRFVSEDPIGYASGDINYYAYVLNNPAKFRDPMGLVKVWGNWCGPDWTGGLDETYTPVHDLFAPERIPGTPFYAPPVDPLDNACRIHDICYYKCRTRFPCDRKARGQCMTICDRQLSYDAAAAGHTLGSPIYWWMKENQSPNPGTNKSCGCSKGE